ncbi:TPA: adhesin [Proteus mirabilis]|nr:adhesin [Proteus mirabilis]
MLRIFLTSLLFISFLSNADYAPQIDNPSDGFFVSFGGNATIASSPIIASDGSKYYKVGNTYSLSGSKARGGVKCNAFFWGPPNIGRPPAWHRVFVYQPSANITIDGLQAYRVNSNVVFTLQGQAVGKWWQNGDPWISACYPAGDGSELAPVSMFQQQFPISVTIYINEKIIDNHVTIPNANLAGYVRAFNGGPGSAPPPFNSWDFSKTTAPIHLENSDIMIPSKCTVKIDGINSSKLELNHGIMNAKEYFSEVKSTVNYECKFSSLTKVKFKLDYIKDDDPLKRVPLSNIGDLQSKIYSELVLIDNNTGKEAGTELRTSIKDFQSLTIRSTLKGSNAVAGNYQGTAWLIATFD